MGLGGARDAGEKSEEPVMKGSNSGRLSPP
jgi:hypothetical protein